MMKLRVHRAFAGCDNELDGRTDSGKLIWVADIKKQANKSVRRTIEVNKENGRNES